MYLVLLAVRLERGEYGIVVAQLFKEIVIRSAVFHFSEAFGHRLVQTVESMGEQIGIYLFPYIEPLPGQPFEHPVPNLFLQRKPGSLRHAPVRVI